MYCKIIATAFNPNRSQRGIMNWPFHGQVLHTPERYIALIKKTIEFETTYDPGVPVDTYVVVYQDEIGIWKEWLPYDKTPTKSGTLNIILEVDDGGVYRGYNRGYFENKDKYDWFIFTPDDIMVFGDQYYKKILDKWTYECGYIGLQGVTPNHVQGSIGLTHNYILQKLAKDSGGELPHHKGKWQQEHDINEGEIPFTNRIQMLGYKLVPYNESQEWNPNNLCMPYHNLSK